MIETDEQSLSLPHKCIKDNDITRLKSLISTGETDIESPDETGTTLLSASAYHGNLDLAKFLVSCGAEINCYTHKDGYTPLFFASIGGHLAIIEFLLERGARIQDQNRLNRTAADIAGFIGNHKVVALLNSYISLTELLKYTKPNGINKVVRLPPSLLHIFHRILVDLNFSPVRVLRTLAHNYQYGKEPTLLGNAESLAKQVIDDLVREHFDPHNNVECIAIKLHLIAETFRLAHTQLMHIQPRKENELLWPLTNLVKKLLRSGNEHGIPICKFHLA
ncbi:hypothetical protein Ciccas_008761 [Cichlidogyrus casuarinus]|uniref:Uncharacterized protein n=1 Tax=Cichlidogyrus casuarinus TaxID=1844966 RepID=A0ABD2PYY9_9PLAT